MIFGSRKTSSKKMKKISIFGSDSLSFRHFACNSMIHECTSDNENVVSQLTGDQKKERLCESPRAVNTVYRAHASEDISKSVCSIDSGAIFPPRLAQELSRNAFVVSILFPGRISCVGTGPRHDPRKSTCS